MGNQLTNFPGGITSMGVPLPAFIAPIPTGKTFFVSSVAGNDGNNGKNTAHPFATLAMALSKCVAARGDVIFLMPGHAEAVIAAAGINVNVEGVNIVGCGFGDDRATFNFGTSPAATMTITAADVTMKNFVTKIALDQVVSPLVISAANCFLDAYEHQDGSAILEAVRAVLTTAAATNLKINMKYVGFTAGTHCVNAIRLVGVAGALINMDFYGKASTAVVEFTTLSTNVGIYGYMYNASVADGSKDVVDTATGSLWFGSVQDGSAGAFYSGGSASAWGATVTTNQAVPAADAVTNATMRDVGGNKTDAAVTVVGTTKSLMAYIKGLVNSILGVGTYVLVQKTIISSNILTASAIDLTTVATGGDFYIENITVMSDVTGLAGGTNFQILQNGAKGLANVLVESVANLGANKTVDLFSASVTKQRMTLKSGQKLQIQNSVANGTGAGTVDITIMLCRVTAGSTITNA